MTRWIPDGSPDADDEDEDVYDPDEPEQKGYDEAKERKWEDA